jgi:hypothetical protein
MIFNHTLFVHESLKTVMSKDRYCQAHPMRSGYVNIACHLVSWQSSSNETCQTLGGSFATHLPRSGTVDNRHPLRADTRHRPKGNLEYAAIGNPVLCAQ